MLKKSYKDILVLVCICAVIALILAATNAATAPTIKANEEKAANEALLQVMPDGKDFEKIDITGYVLPTTVVEAYKESGGGYVFKLNATGYSTGLIIMCGVNSDGTVSGALCISSNETFGKEKTFGELVVGKTSETIADVEAGATSLTVKGYRGAVADALNAAIILGGGSVDIRTEEEKLNDNLSAALSSAEGAFTKLFIVEVIDGVDAIYTADNGKGMVCVIGDNFVGIDENGTAVTETAAENKAAAEAAAAIVSATVMTDITLEDYEGLPSAVVSAKKTATGNYVLTMRGAGYQVNGGSKYVQVSGEYIIIMVSMTADGKILDCVTVSHDESENIGGRYCDDESYYGQFVGKTESQCEAIDTVANATLTTRGYKNAVLKAFESVRIFEGGNEQ